MPRQGIKPGTSGAPYRLAVLYGLGVPGLVAQSVAHLTQEPRVAGSIPGSATYFRFSFGRFKKGSCLLLAKVCARSTG